MEDAAKSWELDHLIILTVLSTQVTTQSAEARRTTASSELPLRLKKVSGTVRYCKT